MSPRLKRIYEWLWGSSRGSPPVGTVLERISALPVWLLLGVAIVVFLLLSVVPLLEESITADEIIHLYAGYLHLAHADFMVNPEHPPLAKQVDAIPLLFVDVNLPPSRRFYHFWYQSGNDPEMFLWWGRVPTLFWGILLLGSVYAVSRDLFGPRGSLVSLVLAAFSPLFLAHSHLITTDVAVVVYMLLTFASFSKLIQQGTGRWAVYSGFMLGGALVTKFSAVMVVPILVWIGLLALVRQGAAGGSGHRPQSGSWISLHGSFRWAGLMLLIGAICYSVLWGCYGFRYVGSDDASLTFNWARLSEEGVTARAVAFAKSHRLIPESFLFGFEWVRKHSAEGHSAYALGQYSDVGWWWYFPFAFLVKTPFPTLILFGGGLLAWFRRSKEGTAREDFLIVPLIVYWVLAINSNMNIGVRHLLPIFPLLMVLAGGIRWGAAETARGLRHQRMVFLLLLGTITSCLAESPHFISYFNVPSRIVAERHEMLCDSNLDWGQDLRRLKTYLDENGIDEIKMAYFGSGSPRHMGINHRILGWTNLYSQFEKEWTFTRIVEPGDVVAVSAMLYLEVLRGQPRDFYQPILRDLDPVAVIGRSIFVFHIPESSE